MFVVKCLVIGKSNF